MSSLDCREKVIFCGHGQRLHYRYCHHAKRRQAQSCDALVALQDWLHIPTLSGETEEDVVARAEDPGNITDDFFPPCSDSYTAPVCKFILCRS